MKTCPTCNNANEHNDYEGPTCARCLGAGLVQDFDEWVDDLDENVIQGEFGYERGEFNVTTSLWRPMFDEGLTPSQAFRRALDAQRRPAADLSSSNDLHYFKSILGHMREIQDAVADSAGLSLGNMALADNIDWLDCYIDAKERAETAALPAAEITSCPTTTNASLTHAVTSSDQPTPTRSHSSSNAPATTLPDDVRIPLHSLWADSEYLIGRVIADGSCGSMVVKSIRDRLDQIEAGVIKTAALTHSVSPQDGGVA